MVSANEDDYGIGIISNGGVIDLNRAGAISTLSLKDNAASVLGDGVRLRKALKKTATILELMYHNDVC